MKRDNDYLIVHKSILPDYFESVVKARDMILEEQESVSNACRRVNISRSTYYKYKDYVFVPSSQYGKRVIMQFTVDNEHGILSSILNCVACQSGNIIAIHQETPIRNRAYVTITIDIMEMDISMNELIEKLKQLKGVINVELVAVE